MSRDTVIRIDSSAMWEACLQASRVVLTTHVNPDGDALGSEAAMYHILRDLRKEVTILNHSPLPVNLEFMAKATPFQQYNTSLHRRIIEQADTIFVLDVNDSERVESLEADILASPAKIFVIDHHLYPKPFADGYLLREDASATGELIFDMIEDKYPSTPPYPIAEALYVAIMTDTGSFKFERTTPRVHRIAAALLAAGLEPTVLYRNIYDDYTLNRMRLVGEALAGITPVAGGKGTIVTISRALLEKHNCSYEDAENLSGSGLGIRGVEITALITELEDRVKVSLRSRGVVSVYDIAVSFGGGGHIYASGAKIVGLTLDEVVVQVREAFENALKYVMSAE